MGRGVFLNALYLLIVVPAFVFTFFSTLASAKPVSASDKVDFYSLSATSITGKKVDFEQFRGKVVMVVNTASKCGFTPQYRDLQELYSNYKEEGFVVLGFPSGDFRDQEFKKNGEINKFCKFKFGVKFPLFARNSVKGADKQEVFKFLVDHSPEPMRGEIDWNFEKFLIGKDGELRARYGSFTNPLSRRVREEVKRLLS